MTRRSLVIDSKDQGQFFLLVEGGTVTIGGSRKDADTVLQQLRVRSIRCELEVEGEHVTLHGESNGKPGAPRELRIGEILAAGGSRFRLELANDAPAGKSVSDLADDDMPGLRDDEASTVPAPAAPATEEKSSDEPTLRKRLIVIDGADQGQAFLLPESGSVTLGKDRKYADIYLHDLYVARVNCQVKIDGDTVTVVHQAGVSGTMINGKKITEQAMFPGDVLRIGNSHLRLECVVPGEEFAKFAGSREEDDEGEIGIAKEGKEADEDTEDVEVVEEDVEVEVVEDEEGEAAEAESDDIPESVRVLRVLRDKLMQLSGHTFGHYRLGAVLGRGATGVVFRADHLETGQVVALKVFLPLFPHGDQELTRFARVMKGLLPLRHPHLVALLGAGKTGTYTWVAREYIEGESLTEVFRRLGKSQRPDCQLGLRVALHLGRALDFARKHHLRHGKITPANIFLQQRGEKGTKLADLMLGGALEGSRLWLAGKEHWPMSELAYLSPEQTAQGAFVDELSDLYSLGAVVYGLLTGRPPFVGKTREDLIEQIQGPSKPTRPSHLNDEVPAALDKIVMKMLTKHQENRYQTASELLEDLQPIEEEFAS